MTGARQEFEVPIPESASAAEEEQLIDEAIDEAVDAEVDARIDDILRGI